MQQYENIESMSFEQKNALKKMPSATRQVNSKADEPSDEGNHWVQHKVKRGESLEKIANDYNVAIADLKSWNKLHRNRIYAGQSLEVYVGSSSVQSPQQGVSQKPAAVPAAPVKLKTIKHRVKKGETLEKIAALYNVSVSDLKKWNKLSTSRVLAGRKLRIHLTSDNMEYYHVRSGDTLWNLSKKFGVSVDDIQRWNALAADIHAGDRLVIYH
jgi:LysM repeat protein